MHGGSIVRINVDECDPRKYLGGGPSVNLAILPANCCNFAVVFSDSIATMGTSWGRAWVFHLPNVKGSPETKEEEVV